MPYGTFYLPYNSSSVTPSVSTWVRPSDWIDVSNVGNNEINILAGDFGSGYVAFRVSVLGSSTYEVNWGNGSISSYVGTTSVTAQNIFASGLGQPCSLGYTTYKISISSASPITSFSIVRHSNFTQSMPSILEVALGTTGLTTCANMFYSPDGTCFCESLKSVILATTGTLTANSASRMFQNCYSLENVEFPLNWDKSLLFLNTFYACRSLRKIKLPSITANSSFAYTFYGCFNLEYIEFPTTSLSLVNTSTNMFVNCYSLTGFIWPDSMTSVNNTSYMFQSCSKLQTVIGIPSGLPITNATGMFNGCVSLTKSDFSLHVPVLTNVSYLYSGCYSLSQITITGNLSAVTNSSYMFADCHSLKYVSLPTSLSGVTNSSYMFQNAYSLTGVFNDDFIGSSSSNVDGTSMYINAESMNSISSNAKFTKFGVNGASGKLNKLTSLRLLNATSPFSGTSPQIDISYTTLSTAAIIQVFNDLPTVSGKTININGSSGASGLTPTDRLIATNKGWTISG